MKVEELEAKVKALENEVRTLKDIEEIRTLQRCYGYYLEHCMYNELADLWTDDGEMQWLGYGTVIGKEHIRKQWSLLPGQGTLEFLHQAIQISGIITIEPGGKTAKGRWNCLLAGVLPMGKQKKPGGMLGTGLYENEYIKQNGVWKIKKLQYGGTIGFQIQPIGIAPERLATPNDFASDTHMQEYPYDIRHDEPNPDYPSGYIRPFHFKHPVTGKKTSEEAWNISHKAGKKRGT